MGSVLKVIKGDVYERVPSNPHDHSTADKRWNMITA